MTSTQGWCANHNEDYWPRSLPHALQQWTPAPRNAGGNNCTSDVPVTIRQSFERCHDIVCIMLVADRTASVGRCTKETMTAYANIQATLDDHKSSSYSIGWEGFDAVPAKITILVARPQRFSQLSSNIPTTVHYVLGVTCNLVTTDQHTTRAGGSTAHYNMNAVSCSSYGAPLLQSSSLLTLTACCMLHRHEQCSNEKDAVNSSVWSEIVDSQIMTSIKPVYSV